MLLLSKVRIHYLKTRLTLGFVFVLFQIGFNQNSYSQNQAVADSLENVFHSGNYLQTDELKVLLGLAQNYTETEKKIRYSELLIEKATSVDSISYMLKGLMHKGRGLTIKGDLSSALESYFNAASIASENSLTTELGKIYAPIADVYSSLDDHENAVLYYHQSIDILSSTTDSVSLATALLNLGDEFFNHRELDSALIYFSRSGGIFQTINYPIGSAYNFGNIGLVRAELGQDSLAISNINKAINILESFEDYYAISVYLAYMSDIYAKRSEWPTAFSNAERSLELAMEHDLKKQISDSYLQLSELHELKGNHNESLENYKQHIAYRDSVTNVETVQEMANLRTDYEVSQKQIEVDLLSEQKRNQQLVTIATGIALLLIGVLAVGLFRRNKFIAKNKKLVETEKERSDKLLLNILPEETAQELKDKGKVQAKRFDSVTVMFTDFKGFTAYSDKLSPEELVESVDYYYSKFDEIIEKYGLEKIKTVGDAYMCAGGLPFPSDDHADKMVQAAFEIAEFVKESKKFDPDDLTRFDIRIGINTGPVVAGVVGSKKFAYDIWGDTVNIASRMESNSKPGKINISENTYQLVKDKYSCTFRGEIEAKNKGMMKMYFVNKS